MARTFYDILMISPRADREVITVVFRHLAKRYHPDIDPSPEAASRMAELNEAYAILTNGARRARYDETIGLDADRGRSPADVGTDAPVDPAPTPTSPYGEAGPPPKTPVAAGSVLNFGRYRGWSLNQVRRVDRDYLEWLARTTVGRNYRQELEQLLRR